MPRSRRVLALALAFTAGLAAVRPTQGTTLKELDDVELTKGARTIVHGDVVSKESFFERKTGRIYTEYRFAVRELLKGESDSDGTVFFREWGGEVDGMRYYLPGLQGYALGEEVVAFLGDPDPSTGVGFTFGFSQGKFRVVRDSATGNSVVKRNLGELRLVGPKAVAPTGPDEHTRGAQPDASEAQGRDLEAFKAWLRVEVSR